MIFMAINGTFLKNLIKTLPTPVLKAFYLDLAFNRVIALLL